MTRKNGHVNTSAFAIGSYRLLRLSSKTIFPGPCNIPRNSESPTDYSITDGLATLPIDHCASGVRPDNQRIWPSVAFADRGGNVCQNWIHRPVDYCPRR